ncbi:MAG TPA: plastocyanin/azurin family copper-binding protein, partial [Thermoleophilaceae bacterium]|nr:plastocyanin/azurin family copper-binding protein [Thermoleophilaceae bacterium]
KDDSAGGGKTQAQSGGFKKVAKVDIRDFKYRPPKDEVKVGQSIKFTNQDTAKHTATSQPQGTFDSGDLEKGQTKPVKFTKAGTYTYYCVYHAFMKGKVKVVG